MDIGQGLQAMKDQLTSLQTTITDPSEQDKINVRLEEVDFKIYQLVDGDWQKGDDYAKATNQINAATDALKNARKGLAAIDGALKMVDDAISMIASLLSLVPK
jgi:hypothetical protein